jgi:hypothetical protein
MLSRCFAALSALACVSATPLPYSFATQSGIRASLHPEVVKVDCLTGAGTAFRVGRHTLYSARHVTTLKGCFIDGKPFDVWEGPGDYSIITVTDDSPKYLKVDCDGFVANRHYESIGYARGLDTLTTVDLTATGASMDIFAVLSGVFTVVPGMSGGPVIDPATGKVVGIVNLYNMQAGMSGSIPLKATPICQS